MASAELKAKARSGVGKGAARALRREGWIPAVIYGDKKDPLPISISYNEAMKSIYGGGFLSHVISVDVDGTKHQVIPRDYQLDVVKDKALHVDFLRVGPNTKLHVEVAVGVVDLRLVGAVVGVEPLAPLGLDVIVRCVRGFAHGRR